MRSQGFGGVDRARFVGDADTRVLVAGGGEGQRRAVRQRVGEPGDPGQPEVLVRLGEDDRPGQRGVQQPGRDARRGVGQEAEVDRAGAHVLEVAVVLLPARELHRDHAVEAGDDVREVADAAGGDQAEPFDRADAQTIAARKRVEQPAGVQLGAGREHLIGVEVRLRVAGRHTANATRTGA